ncbi:hypothetical protein [uncultured Desulfovibrio sp.]|uniref:hypothetical protein n=1 Tax=uncultured Desulfovibrio sp. TaxID=167968 RepID=UPI002629A557|nr:hypothetical protein [uncultured Desulfovibrio sp.]
MDGKQVVKSCHGTEQQEARDAKGRWKPGQSGNPLGPKPGASCRALLMAREWTESVGLPRLMEAAEGGDMDAIKLLVQLGMPRTKAVSIPQQLPSSPAGVLDAMASGELDADTASTAMGAHLTAAKIKEMADLEARIQALESALKQKE